MSKKTITTLSKLKKIKKFDLDEKRQALIELQNQLQDLYREVKNLHSQQEIEIESARTDNTVRLNLPIYLDGLRKKQNKIKEKIYNLADFMIPIEESVRESFREVKALELTIDSLHDKARSKEEKLEQNSVDELNQHRKNVNQND